MGLLCRRRLNLLQGKNVKKALFAIVIAGASASSFAGDCWSISGLSGYGVRYYNSYEVEKDGMSNTHFVVEFQGDAVRITMLPPEASQRPSETFNCSRTSKYSALCNYSDKYSVHAEFWGINPDQNKAVFSKFKHGSGQYDGADMFVGISEKIPCPTP